VEDSIFVGQSKTKQSFKDLSAEVEEALRRAEWALMDAPLQPKEPSTQVKKAADVKAVIKFVNPGDAAAASLGGGILGFIFGMGVDYFLSQDLSYSFSLLSLDALVPPAVLGTLFAAITLFIVQQDSPLSSFLIAFLGFGPKNIAQAITNSIQNALKEVNAIPGKIQNAIKRKVDDTVQEVQAIPGKVVTKTKEVTAAAVEEIKATPARVAQSTKTAVVATVDNTKKAIVKTVDDTKTALFNIVNKTINLPVEVFKSVPEPFNANLPKPPKIAPSVKQIKRQMELVFLNVDKTETFA